MYFPIASVIYNEEKSIGSFRPAESSSVAESDLNTSK